jgi:copper chaperone CopZ
VTKTINLQVVGEKTMNCGGCERSVTTALSQLPGVQSVNADRVSQGVTVVADSAKTDLNAIKAELNAIGYQVEPVLQ